MRFRHALFALVLSVTALGEGPAKAVDPDAVERGEARQGCRRACSTAFAQQPGAKGECLTHCEGLAAPRRVDPPVTPSSAQRFSNGASSGRVCLNPAEHSARCWSTAFAGSPLSGKGCTGISG